jgi:hypothetical protein
LYKRQVDGDAGGAVAAGERDAEAGPPMSFMHIKKEEEEVTFAVKGVAAVAPKEEVEPKKEEKPAPAPVVAAEEVPLPCTHTHTQSHWILPGILKE